MRRRKRSSERHLDLRATERDGYYYATCAVKSFTREWPVCAGFWELRLLVCVGRGRRDLGGRLSEPI